MNLENKVLSKELINPVHAYAVMAGCGGPYWKDACDDIDKMAEKIDKLNIPFAVTEDGNMLKILVSETNKELPMSCR